ncbi:MAG: hypothetical protein MGG11_16660 [Trichodesmium sp. MAG_R03]|nr:hypothetical protein [Trichodesmium sp. MAG_R03]
MDSSVNNNSNTTLLAILLALYNLQLPLSAAEKAAFKTAGQSLSMPHNNRESIIKDLMDKLVTNSSFTQLYQAAKSQLDAVSDQILYDQPPTENELKHAWPDGSEVVKLAVKRAHFEGKPDDKNNEILNMAISILTTPEPTKTAQKLTRIEKLWQFLNQPIFKND